jgi:peptidoglycan/xylan/chitin deacetylase (PgdA/CDA1 family)
MSRESGHDETNVSRGPEPGGLSRPGDALRPDADPDRKTRVGHLSMWSVRRLRRLASRVRQWGQPRALILFYHRVGDLPMDPHSLTVTAAHFQEHLDVLRTRTKPMHLDELIRRTLDGTLPDRAAAVTFDDGYMDNLIVARPLLQRYGVPATVFVTTGYLDGHGEFWWDELERLLLWPGTLPSSLRLDIDGRTSEVSLAETTEYGSEAFDRNRAWRFKGQCDPSPRHRIYRSLWHQLRPLPAHKREKVVSELRMQAGKVAAVRPTHRTLRPEQLVELTDEGLVEVGAHTETHPMLSALAPSVQEQEIRRSKSCLEEILGREVRNFAYPYGGRQDYTPTTVRAVREAGFASACSTSAGLVLRGLDRYELPRVGARDWSGDSLAHRLDEYFNG